MNTKFKHKLMFNNFHKEDFKPVINLLKKKNPILTQSKSVEKFEINWSKWLGVKHSVFVNSGASANFLSMFILKEIAGQYVWWFRHKWVPCLYSFITGESLGPETYLYDVVNLNDLDMSLDWHD